MDIPSARSESHEAFSRSADDASRDLKKSADVASRDPQRPADGAVLMRSSGRYERPMINGGGGSSRRRSETMRSSYPKVPLHIPAVRFATGDPTVAPAYKDDKRLPMKPILWTGTTRARLSPARSESIPVTAGHCGSSALSASAETSFVAVGVTVPHHISRRLTDSQLVGRPSHVSQWQSSNPLGSQWETNNPMGGQWTGRAVPAARYARQSSLSQITTSPRY